MKSSGTCPHCGAKMVEYRHRLSRPLVSALARLEKAGGRANIAEIGLTHNQVCNFQKLRYWGFVWKVGNGEWELTEHGREFLNHGVPTYTNAITFRGKQVRMEGKAIYARELLPESYQRREEFAVEARPVEQKTGQMRMFR
jgi:hypothetical protein